MFLMTAKVSRRRLIAAACGLLVLIAGMMLLLRTPEASETLASGAIRPAVKTPQLRKDYLEKLGWQVGEEQSMQVRIPKDGGEVFTRYNELQKSQGFDLTKFAGKTVQRCIFDVQNFPGASAPVRATLLLYRGRLIGGDLTDTSPGGKIQGLVPVPSEPPASTDSAK